MHCTNLHRERKVHLHSNMSLLISDATKKFSFFSFYLHSNMSLLIFKISSFYTGECEKNLHSNMSLLICPVNSLFMTSHKNLHSNMSLLICVTKGILFSTQDIYIPICLY